MQRLVKADQTPGLLAYLGDTPVGWCALAPRTVYRRLETSRILKPVDDQPTWSVPCFFVAKGFRRQGVSGALLRAAVEFAREHGATILEGYPTECRRTQPDAFVYTGLASVFQRAGFAEVARRSAHRPMMRLKLGPGTTAR